MVKYQYPFPDPPEFYEHITRRGLVRYYTSVKSRIDPEMGIGISPLVPIIATDNSQSTFCLSTVNLIAEAAGLDLK